MNDVNNLKELLIMFGYNKEDREFSQHYSQKGWPTVVINQANSTIIISSITHIVLRVKFAYASEAIDYILKVASKKK